MRPLRDHEGARLHQDDAGAASFGVRFTGLLPSAFMRKTAQYPSRRLMNAIRRPSGDHVAIWLMAVGKKVRRWTFFSTPSASATYTSLPRRKTICCPSGDQSGH